jgi:large subunit ribosomal protein L16
MLSPKKVKYRKMQRGRLKGKANRNITLHFGTHGLQALEPTWLTANQIEAARKVIVRYIKKIGKLWINIFPNKVVTERAAESRMGSGKGAVKYWAAVIKPGHILFEITGLSDTLAKQSLSVAATKLPIKTKIITNS